LRLGIDVNNGRTIRLRDRRPLRAAAVVWMVAASCTAAPTEPPDLDGSYRFTQDNYEGDTPMRGLPFLPIREVLEGSTVRVSLSPERIIVVEYTDRAGVPSVAVTALADEHVSWDEDSLSIAYKPPHGVPILPGLALEVVRVECRRESDGCLTLDWSYGEYGLMLFIVPFVDADRGRLVLEPVAPGS
jgi:hypothetical protein